MTEIKGNPLYYNENIRKVIKSDVYKGYRYFVVSIGNHPTAYIELSSEEIKKPWEDIIEVHGGITYQEEKCGFDEEGLKDNPLIGWDYAHAGDAVYAMWYNPSYECKWWTVEEIEKDCCSVIEQVIAEGKK